VRVIQHFWSVIPPLVFCSLSSFAEQGRVIEEIVVTAEKRTSTVQETPIAITAFDTSFIENMGMSSPSDLQDFTPSMTVQDFDVTIRGIGRNFRTLGGDPGVATYQNGVYSEDFGIVFTENEFYDVERIEVLRGPQGTLYGRNAIGGALNVINRKPTDTFEGELRVDVGDNNTVSVFGFLSGPLTENFGVRLVGSKIDRDGNQDNANPLFDDLNSKDTSTGSIAMRWTPRDDLELNLRYNQRESDRIPGQAGLCGMGSNNGPANTTALVFLDTDLGGASAPGAFPGVVDAANNRTNAFYGHSNSPSYSQDCDDLEFEGDTSHQTKEKFFHESVFGDATWDIRDGEYTIKYVGGYVEFSFEPDWDTDLSGSMGSRASNIHFIVDQDLRAWSHEVQFLTNWDGDVNFILGAYNYYAKTNQYIDFADEYSAGKFLNPFNYGFWGGLTGPGNEALPPVVPFDPNIPVCDANLAVSSGAGCVGTTVGNWGGDPNGTFFQYDNNTEVTSYAAFAQMEWQLAEQWALTMGVRWSRDEKEGEEMRFGYAESRFGLDPGVLQNFACGPAVLGPAADFVQSDLDCLNLYFNSFDFLFDRTDPAITAYQGTPLSFGDAMEIEDDWEKVTYRINLDYEPNDDTLAYGSITTGYRSGGFNLGLRQITPYDEEVVTAFEVGLKTQLLDNRLQLNTALYYYDYEDHQIRVEEQADFFDPFTGLAVSGAATVDVVQNAPEATNWGFEVETVWLATERLTFGGNYSYTHAEYDKFAAVNIKDPNNIGQQGLIGDPSPNEVVDVKGNDLNRIPEHKFNAWGSYTWDTSLGNFSFTTTYAWVDEQVHSPFGLDIDSSPDYAVWDAYFVWNSNAGRYQVRTYVTNILDEIGIATMGISPESGNFRRTASMREPRAYGMQFRVKFGDYR
jgi:iron complex outermembrane receptor protein